MMYEIVLEEKALNEIQQAFNQYRETSLQTASNFEKEIEQSLNHMKSGIAGYRELLPSVRVFSLSGFPFNIYYRRIEDESLVQVIAFLHTRRNEDFIFNRLSGA